MTPTAGAGARRAAGLVVLALVLAAVCGLLGRWQWIRHVDRDAVIAGIEANYDAAPVPLEQLLTSPGAAVRDDDVWRPVLAVGHYDTAHTVLLRNRPVDGNNGFQLLVPFVVESAGGTGRAAVLVVDRGWMPADSGGRLTAVPGPPPGTVRVMVRLRADEPASPRDAPAGQVQAISVDQVLTAGGLDAGSVAAYRAYGALADEEPAAAERIGGLPKPSLDPGSHLSYAFQWWTFALGALIGFCRLAWLEVHEPEQRERPARPGRGPTTEDEEDALIDAQLATSPGNLPESSTRTARS